MTPADVHRSRAAAVVRPPDSSQPAVRTIPPATSIETAMRPSSASTKSASERPEGGCPEDHAGDTRRRERLGVGDRAHPAAELHRHPRRRGGRVAGQLDRRAAVSCGAERHDVDAGGSGRGELPDEGQRVTRVQRHPVVVAAGELGSARPSSTSTAGMIANSCAIVVTC